MRYTNEAEFDKVNMFGKGFDKWQCGKIKYMGA